MRAQPIIPPAPRTRSPRLGGEVFHPRLVRAVQVGPALGAVEHVARPRGIHDTVAGHVQRRQRVDAAALVVPEHAAFAHRHGADAAAARFQQVQQAFRRQAQLFAHALRADGDVDIA
ncbi:hypothetical protein G6F22_018728 [Rhizopus arrhizus]|nr:hypothetical protein G6F22_018728 [Rhizopus arrhizus]